MDIRIKNCKFEEKFNIKYIVMENKIQELAEKLLKDGVEKGNAEAEKIITAANEKAAQIKEWELK